MGIIGTVYICIVIHRQIYIYIWETNEYVILAHFLVHRSRYPNYDVWGFPRGMYICMFQVFLQPASSGCRFLIYNYGILSERFQTSH